jgi:hypothetical protein
MENLICRAAIGLGVIREDELKDVLLENKQYTPDEVYFAIEAAKILNKDRNNGQ